MGQSIFRRLFIDRRKYYEFTCKVVVENDGTISWMLDLTEGHKFSPDHIGGFERDDSKTLS